MDMDMVMVYERFCGTAGLAQSEKTVRAQSLESAKADGIPAEQDCPAPKDGAVQRFYRPMVVSSVRKAEDMVETKRKRGGRVKIGATPAPALDGVEGMPHIKGIPSGDEKEVLIPYLKDMGNKLVRWTTKLPINRLPVKKDMFVLYPGFEHPGERPTNSAECVEYRKRLNRMVALMRAQGIVIPADIAACLPNEAAKRLVRESMRVALHAMEREEVLAGEWLALNAQREHMGIPVSDFPGMETVTGIYQARVVAYELEKLLEKASDSKTNEEKAKAKRDQANRLVARETPYHRASDVKPVMHKTGTSASQRCRNDSHSPSQSWMRKSR